MSAMTRPSEPVEHAAPPEPTGTAAAGPGRRRRRWWAVGAAGVAVVALVAGGITFFVLRSGEPVDTRFEVRSLEPVAEEGRLPAGTVQLPAGRLQVEASAPLREVPDSTPAVVEQQEEPGRVRGFGRWVGVEWRFGTPPDPDRFWDPAVRQPKQFQVALVADGTRRDLAAGETADPDPIRNRGYLPHKALWVALPGEPGALTLEVTYDGLTQTLDLRTGRVDAGAAAPLYRKEAWTAASRPCTDGKVTIRAPGFAADEDDVEVLCTLTEVALAAPYLPGKGWARPGRTWVTFQLRTQASLAFVRWPSMQDPDPVLYRLALQSSAVTAGGAAPALVTSYYQQGLEEQRKLNLSGAYYSFDVPAAGTTRVSVHQVYAGRTKASRPGSPAEARGTVDVAIDLAPGR